ncbi:MAG: peptide chain release factor 3, partial [Alphaproteobacteria bacterium]|nr:peptide chain release factor 3 [Alphaproteobacteria bacterium]
IMVIDAAKGIETQTRKLFEVCRLRDIPIVTFINKMDREARDPFDLIDEIADTLQLHVTPAMWPVGSGLNFRGAMDFEKNHFLPFARDAQPVGHNRLGEVLTADEHKHLNDEMELARGGYPAFDLANFREGHLTPIYFGAALKNFGIRELITGLGAHAPGPRAQPAVQRTVLPDEDKVAGFVFKVQANMDPNHRDRVAFMRVCSGHFKRGMKLKQSGSGKMISVHNPILFFAQSRATVDEAWPGDIIGIPNHGVLRVGDTLTEGEDLTFTGIPNFAPEIIRRVRLADPLKAKHLQRALEALAEEGVTQVFRPKIGGQWFVGVVGQLQLDVLASRIAAEYGLEVAFEQGLFETARWVACDDAVEMRRFLDAHQGNLADDRDGAPVFMAKSAWELRYSAERWPKIKFTATKERRH